MGSGFDTIVIGAGHNGLTAALTLAKAKRRVLVVERSKKIGGIAAKRQFAPGYRVPGLMPDTSSYRPELIRELGLEKHGLSLRSSEAAIFVPNGGDGILLHPGEGRADGISDDDAKALSEWQSSVAKLESFATGILDGPPPPLGFDRLPDLMKVGRLGLALRMMGRDAMIETMRTLPMCVADWLREHFDDERLAAAIAAPSLIGSYTGPWSSGTAAMLVLHESTRNRSVQGGGAALIAALERACGAAGVEIRSETAVERMLVDRTGVRGIRTASGEEIEAPLVVASCAPQVVLLDLVGPRHLSPDTERDLRNFRSRGITAVLLLAVEGPVSLGARPNERIERLRVGAQSFDDLERAFDAVKYNRSSTEPYLEVWIPSIETPDIAPEGCNVVAALVSCAPYDLAGGWSKGTSEVLIQAAVHQINDHIPKLRARLAGGSLIAPPDLEAEIGLPGGHLHQGEQALDQMLFLRPSLHLSNYATEIEGLFLGASGSHPGGGITGMPGWLGAKAALAAGR